MPKFNFLEAVKGLFQPPENPPSMPREMIRNIGFGDGPGQWFYPNQANLQPELQPASREEFWVGTWDPAHLTLPERMIPSRYERDVLDD
jgi:hypothetical protein